ncbi:hypothetical protein OBBRIDRAFT_745276, partial [Obba rivulosa]
MSNLSSTTELDFWEFVHCSRCYLPFQSSPDAPPPVPFWLTECGHVICNNHLNPDQSCSQCGAQDIQLAPLQKDMDVPMSNWFSPAPAMFDTAAYAAKFQMETMSSIARYHKHKAKQHRGLLERLKEQFMALKKSWIFHLMESGGCLTALGKHRRSTFDRETHVYSFRYRDGARSHSSPRSIATPIGPNRLTLPPEHQRPTFPNQSPLHAEETSRDTYRNVGDDRAPDRPGSSRFAEQFAYNPPQAQHGQAMRAPVLSHAQAAPMRQAEARQAAGGQTRAHTSTVPPPPAQPTFRNGQAVARQQDTGRSSSRMQMRPPPTPQRKPDQQRAVFRPPVTPQVFASSSASSQRIVPLTPSRAR